MSQVMNGNKTVNLLIGYINEALLVYTSGGIDFPEHLVMDPKNNIDQVNYVSIYGIDWVMSDYPILISHLITFLYIVVYVYGLDIVCPSPS